MKKHLLAASLVVLGLVAVVVVTITLGQPLGMILSGLIGAVVASTLQRTYG